MEGGSATWRRVSPAYKAHDQPQEMVGMRFEAQGFQHGLPTSEEQPQQSGPARSPQDPWLTHRPSHHQQSQVAGRAGGDAIDSAASDRASESGKCIEEQQLGAVFTRADKFSRRPEPPAHSGKISEIMMLQGIGSPPLHGCQVEKCLGRP
jgi:hypothetical protein